MTPLLLLQYNELVDKVTSSETKVSEMETTVEDLQWDMEKLRNREQKLNKHLAEAMEQVRLTSLCAFFPCLLLVAVFIFICWVLTANSGVSILLSIYLYHTYNLILMKL